MKKNPMIFAALCAIAFVACNKEGIETNVPKVTVPVSIDIAVPDETMKITLDPTTLSQTWTAGDEVKFCSYLKKGDASDAVAHNSNNVLTTAEGGPTATFTGELNIDSEILANYSKADNYIISPASAWLKTSTNSEYVRVPATQSGKLSDFGKYSISMSRNLRLVKTDDVYSVPDVKTMYNLCPVIKFNVAEGLGVKKIIIEGYSNGTATLLVAEKSTGDAIQIKPGGPTLYKTSSDTKTLTIDRTPDAYLAGKEEISGDVYAFLAPNFPQTTDIESLVGMQWTDKDYSSSPSLSYKFYDDATNLDYHRPYNTCDSLTFTFINKDSLMYVHKAKLSSDSKLYSGKIKSLGTISRDIFIPAPVLSLDATTGNLMCTNTDPDVTMYYSISKTTSAGPAVPTEPSAPAAPEIDDANIFPAGGIAMNDALTYAKIKILPFKNGKKGVVTNAYIRKFVANSNVYDMTLAPGDSSYLGFIKFKNVHDTYYVRFIYSSNSYNYRHFKTGDNYTSENTAGNGKYAIGRFSSQYPNASATFYAQQKSKNRAIYFIYDEGAPNIPTAYTKLSATSSDWYTGPNFSAATVNGNGTVTISMYTDSTPIKGFAWLEQGFAKF